MILTQDELDVPIRNIYGKEMQNEKEEPITLRLLFIESILRPQDGRTGAEKLKGVAMANKVNLPMGNLTLGPDEVKFISDRVDEVDWTDYLYDHIYKALNKPAVVELPKEG